MDGLYNVMRHPQGGYVAFWPAPVPLRWWRRLRGADPWVEAPRRFGSRPEALLYLAARAHHRRRAEAALAELGALLWDANPRDSSGRWRR